MKICNISKKYVLVHGAWHGSWCWHKVAKKIQEQGHHVITPDLPGHYLNKRQFKEVSLRNYVESIETLINSLQQPVILVGHSMAGVVITQVAENIPDKINLLIYTAGFIPKNNGSLIDEEKKASIPSVSLKVKIDEVEGSISLESSKSIRNLFYGNCNDEDVNYALPLLQKQSLRPFIEPVSITEARFGSVPKLYIECLQDKAIMIQDQRRMYSKIKCDVETLDTDHSPFFSACQELTNIICSSSARKSTTRAEFLNRFAE